jgi:hypothetical protein
MDQGTIQDYIAAHPEKNRLELVGYYPLYATLCDISYAALPSGSGVALSSRGTHRSR